MRLGKMCASIYNFKFSKYRKLNVGNFYFGVSININCKSMASLNIPCKINYKNEHNRNEYSHNETHKDLIRSFVKI
jgi:hypothetical protein